MPPKNSFCGNLRVAPSGMVVVLVIMVVAVMVVVVVI